MQQADEIAVTATARAAPAPAAPRKGRFRMATSTIMLILAASALGVIGQMMLKVGMSAMGPLSLSAAGAPLIAWRMATTPMVVGGLLVYAAGTFFWLITLSRIELSVAYPFVSLNHVIIFLLAWLVLREQITPTRTVGVLVICIGMLLVARS